MGLTIRDVVGSAGGWSVKDGWRYTIAAKLDADADDPKPGPRAVLQALGLAYDATYRFPLTEEASETDPTSHLQSISVQAAEEDGRTYTATVEFGRYDVQQDKGDTDEHGKPDPFSAPPTVKARGEDEERAALFSRHGNPILNTAGDPMPGLTYPDTTLVYAVTRNERSCPRDRITNFKNRLNESEWQGFPAESVKLQNVTPSCSWDQEAGCWVWEVEYEFAYREPITIDSGGDEVQIIPGWTARVLNAGLRQLVGGERKQILIDNAPASEPVALKEDGTVSGPSDAPHFLFFDVLPTADFEDLGFPAGIFDRSTPEPTPSPPPPGP